VTKSQQQAATKPGREGGSGRTWRRGPLASRVFREIGLVTIGMCALAVIMTWPALRDPAHTYPTTSIDPQILIWAIAWAGHGLVHQPLHVFNANVFYPAPLSLAFTDSMLGYAPVNLLTGGSANAVFDYNLVFAAAPALTGVAGYALARQLGAKPLAAAVAGLGLAFAPWRTEQFAHLHILSTGPFIASLAMLARGHGLSFRGRQGPWRPLWVVLGWLAAAWQVSIGFGVGLPFTYLLAVIAAATLAVWLLRRMPRPPWRVLTAELAGGAVFCTVVVLMGIPYLTVAKTQADAVAVTRSLAQVQKYSPTWLGFLRPTNMNGAWSWLLGHPFNGIASETNVLPGYVLIALAVLGLFYSVWLVRWRITVAVGTAIFSALALGTHLVGGGEAGFVFLWRYLPGWEANRAPGRLVMFVTLGLAILAAGAVTRLTEQLAPDGPRSRAGALRLAAVAVLPLLVIAEGFSRVPQTTVLPVPAAMKNAPGPLVVLPSVWAFDPTVMAWSAMTRFPPVANGSSGITPDSLKYMRQELYRFPDATSVAYLRKYHFRSVVVLKDQTGFPPYHHVNPYLVPAPALGLKRVDMGDSVLYAVEPGLSRHRL
jgi:hypothetical protein